jgi:HAE1 family hydrophobic/amphiphilic exporter-1
VTLSDISIERPVLTWMMMVALGVFGVLGYNRLGVDQFPEMEFPVVTVDATLEGATPEGIEEDVTDPLEERFTTISGIRTIRSSSFQGAARIEIEFVLGTDLDVAVQDVRDEVAQAMEVLPREIETPTVTRSSSSGRAILYAPFFSELPLVQVSEYVDRVVKPQIDTIPGVAGAVVFGMRERNIRIWVDSQKLRARGLAASDLIQAIGREHVDRPAGFIEGSSVEWTVKTDAEFKSIDALEGMIVSYEGEAPVYLRDVARVEDGAEDLRSIVHFHGKNTVALGIIKQTDANTVTVANETFRRLEEIRPHLPPEIELAPREDWIDFAAPIVESVEESQFALLFGGLLAVFVVFVFLRRVRPTLVIGLAIPLSLVSTFGLIWLADYTLNTMTLLGLTLAIGVVIDDAIIVLENIERHREEGKSARQAAQDGTREITFAAAAATFSVAAVFVPTIFAEGIVGAFLSEFGLTVAGSVVLSLFVALTLTPMLAARMPPPRPRRPGGVYDRLETGFRGLESRYRRALDWTLRSRRHRALTLGFALLSLLVTAGSARYIGAEFLPPSDGGLVFMRFETPSGSSLEYTAEFLARNEEIMRSFPEVRGMFASLGETSSAGVGRPNAGNLMVTLGSPRERERSSFEIIRLARQKLEQVVGQKAQVMDPFASMNSSNAQFEMILRGNQPLTELDALSRRVVDRLEEVEGFVDLDTSLDLGQPELRIIPDREKAAQLGVDAAAISQVIQVLVGGMDVGVFKEAGNRYDIRMRLEREDNRSPAVIDDLYVRSRTGEVFELRNLVRLETGAAPSEISRTNRQRSVTIFANLEGIPLATAIEKAERVGREVLPEGMYLEPTGDAESMVESFSQFGLMLGLAILAIYMVLAAQFESFLMPLSVMLALPFATVGAFAGLLFFHAIGKSGMTFNLFSLIGIVLLVGLVTKNSILLVDYANQLRAGGMEKVEAMRRAAPVRMRPVLMTAFSMIFGVLPAALGIGPGSETRAPMAVATAAGMFSSMVLTLLIVPVFYLTLDDLSEWTRGLPKRLMRSRRAASTSPIAGSDGAAPR